MSLNTPQYIHPIDRMDLWDLFIKKYPNRSEEKKLASWLEDFHYDTFPEPRFWPHMWPINLTDFKKKIAGFETDFERFISPILLAGKYFHLNHIFMTTKEERERILHLMCVYAQQIIDEEQKQLMNNIIQWTKNDSTRLMDILSPEQEKWVRYGWDSKYIERSQERRQDFWDTRLWEKFEQNQLPISLSEYRETAKIMKLDAKTKEFDQFILWIFEYFAQQGYPKRFEEVFIASDEETQYWNDELEILDRVREDVKNILPPEELQE